MNQTNTENHAATLKQVLAQDNHVLKVPGVYDGLSMKLVQRAGFQAAFLSGACVAFARFGRPDMGLVTVAELQNTVETLRDLGSLPLIVDMDTGFGNALNVQHSVRRLERAGASALQMEDQVMPKRCGHMAGKQVISTGEMVGKIKAALDARQDENTLIIARTDALGVNGFDDAMDRAHQYVEAGADALFIEAPKSVGQMQQIGEEFGSRLPLVHNLVEGGSSPVEQSQDMLALNYKIALYPAALLHVFVPKAEQLLNTINEKGSTSSQLSELVDLDYMNELLDAPELLAKAEHYGED